MKFAISAALLTLTLVMCPTHAVAQQATPATAGSSNWEQLSPAEREALIAPLRQRWNDNPNERTRMLERAKRWQTMPPEQRQRARRGMQRWEHLSPDQRKQARALFSATRGMDKDARKAYLDQWRQMTLQQRNAWMQAHPVPEHQKKQPR